MARNECDLLVALYTEAGDYGQVSGDKALELALSHWDGSEEDAKFQLLSLQRRGWIDPVGSSDWELQYGKDDWNAGVESG